jgi:hypothetical protein
MNFGRETLQRLTTVDLLVLTSLDQVHLYLQLLFNFFSKQANFMRRSTVLNLPLQLVFPGFRYTQLTRSKLETMKRRQPPNKEKTLDINRRFRTIKKISILGKNIP